MLAALTDAVREALPELEALLAGLASSICLCARGARRADGRRRPAVIAARRRAARRAKTRCCSARLERPGRAVVPLDIELDGARPLLVITGPTRAARR